MQKFRDISVVPASNGLLLEVDCGPNSDTEQTLLFTDKDAFLQFMSDTFDSVCPPPAVPVSNVIDGGFYGTTPVPARQVLQYAIDADPEEVLVIAETQEGGFSLRISNPNLPLNIFWLELAKKMMLDSASREENT